MQVRTLGDCHESRGWTVTRAEDELSREGAHRVEKGATGGLTQEKRALNKKFSRGSMSVGDFQKKKQREIVSTRRYSIGHFFTFREKEKRAQKENCKKKQRENLQILSNCSCSVSIISA